MKKSAIIAASIAALMAGSAAADATVYGKAHAAVEQQDITGGAENFIAKSNASRLGFKGSEDLGNGMSAIFQYELQYDVTDGGGVGGSNRNSFVGLKGDFGAVMIGRHDLPSKLAFYAAGNDHLGDSVIDLNGSMGFQEIRASNALVYQAPDMGDIKIVAAVAPGEGDGTAKGDGLTDGSSLALMYKSGAVKVGVGFASLEDVGSYENITNIGGSYKMGDLTLGLQYQTFDDGDTNTVTALVVDYAIGKSSIIASFGTNDDDNESTSVMNLGWKNNMSKRTTGYVAYSSADDGGSSNVGENTKFGVGLIHSF